MSIKSVVGILAVGLAIFVLVQIKNSQRSETEAELQQGKLNVPAGAWKPGAKHLKIGMVIPADSCSAYEKQQIKKAGKDLPNLDIDLRLTASTVASQKAAVDELLKNGVDGIIISPADHRHQAAMLDGVAKKTLLFLQDHDVLTRNRACFVGNDPRETGKAIAKEVLRVVPHGSRVAVFVNDPHDPETEQTLEGIQKELGTGISILADAGISARCHANVLTVLNQKPGAHALVGLSEAHGATFLSVLRKSKMAGKVKVVCSSADPVTLDGIKAGTISATITSEYSSLASSSILQMYKFLNGDRSSIPAGKRWTVAATVISTPEGAEAIRKILGGRAK